MPVAGVDAVAPQPRPPKQHNTTDIKMSSERIEKQKFFAGIALTGLFALSGCSMKSDSRGGCATERWR